MPVIPVKSAVLFLVPLLGQALHFVQSFQQILRFGRGQDFRNQPRQRGEGHWDLVLATPLLSWFLLLSRDPVGTILPPLFSDRSFV